MSQNSIILSVKLELYKVFRRFSNRYLLSTKQLYLKVKTALQVPLKIDVHAVEHCNLNCYGCSHFSPLAKPKFLDPDELEKNLKKLSKFQSSMLAFQILGGEPLLHPRLAEIMDVSRRNLDKTRITLMTNGILLLDDEKLPPFFWESCKKNDIVIRLTTYPIDLDIEAIQKKVSQKGIKFEFFKDRSGSKGWSKYSLHESDLRKKIDRIGICRLKYCGSLNCLQLVGDKIFPCPLSAYIDHLNVAFNRDFKISKKDYIDLNHLNSTWQFRKLLIFSIPFCKYCGGGTPSMEWRRSRRQLEEWIDIKNSKDKSSQLDRKG